MLSKLDSKRKLQPPGALGYRYCEIRRPKVGFTYDSGNCSAVTCSSSSGSGKSDFITQLNENGSGLSQTLSFLSIEYKCAVNYRQVPGPCPYCGGSLIGGSSLAVSANNQDNLTCGNKVFVYQIGTGIVSDHGGGLTANQIDHYEGTGACTANIGTPVSQPAFLLYQ